MTPDNEIARIARLRGRDPANYQAAESGVERTAKKISAQRVRSLFFPPPEPRMELLVYDALPLASRVFLREAPLNMSAIKYSELLEEVHDQAALIGLVSAVIPLRVQEIVRARYGARHPQAGG